MSSPVIPDAIGRYWGKAGAPEEAPGHHPAAYHCLDVAAVAQALIAARPVLARRFSDLSDGVLDLLPLVAALHDLGKVTRHFQVQRPDLFRRLWGEEPGDLSTLRHGEAALILWRDGRLQALLEARTGWGADDLGELLIPSFGHHGRPPERIDDLEAEDILRDESLDDMEALVHGLCDLFLPAGPVAPPSSSEAVRAAGWLCAGLVILADWIGSNRDWFPYHAPSLSLTDYWSEKARPQAEIAIAEAGLVPPAPAAYGGFSALTGITGDPTPLQALCETLSLGEGPELAVIEDTTGSGKTEAALILANRWMAAGRAERLYIGLPTQATSNAMFGRLGGIHRRLFQPETPPSIALAHGGAWLHEGFRAARLAGEQREGDHQGAVEGEEPASPMANRWLADHRKKALLADLGIGTLDQALLGAMGTRHQGLRLLGIAGGVLVADEIHAYDTYTHRLLVALLTFHAALGGSAILLSATLPATRRAELLATYAGAGVGAGMGAGAETSDDPKAQAYPLLTLAPRGAPPTHHPVAAAPGADRPFPPCARLDGEEEAVALLVAAAERGHCGVWIRNTVQDAQEAFDHLSALLPPDRLTLFHARFLPADRHALEADVLRTFGKDSTVEGRRGRILVATQVVEQSLDLDFDVMVSDLAPMDLMIQRAGRLHRHGHRPPRPAPVLHVLGPAAETDVAEDWYARVFHRATSVYPVTARLWLTQNLLTGAGCPDGGWRLPRDARALVEGVYGPDAHARVPAALLETLDQEEGKGLAEGYLAAGVTLDPGRAFDANEKAWTEDITARTRLGEETRPLVLARLEDGRLRPLADRGAGRARGGAAEDLHALRRAWAESELPVAARQMDGPPPLPPGVGEPGVGEEVATLRATLGWPADRPWIGVLTPDGESWLGEGQREGRAIPLRYDPRRGLTLG